MTMGVVGIAAMLTILALSLIITRIATINTCGDGCRLQWGLRRAVVRMRAEGSDRRCLLLTVFGIFERNRMDASIEKVDV